MTDLMPLEYKHDGYTISTDKTRLDIPGIHAFLRESYWASGIPREVVARSIENALCFGVYDDVRQIGFARVISDFATFAYLGDVFILASHRGRGLAKWLLACIRSHPDLQGLRRWMLATRDAHGLYARVGFTQLGKPEIFMELADPGVYWPQGKDRG
jgi:GNAT superfamily N-acetyltransferase